MPERKMKLTKLQYADRILADTADIGKAWQNTAKTKGRDNRSTRGVTLPNPGILHQTYWIP